MKFNKGNIPWNKGKRGVYSDEILQKYRDAKLKNPVKYWQGKKREDISENKHYKWKGDDVGIVALHAWVKKHLGRPSLCEKCGTTDRRWYHWSNISGKYKRELSDWQRLCVPCHSEYDNSKRKNGN